MVYVRLVPHWVFMIGLCGGYLSLNTVNSFLAVFNGCQLRDKYFSTRSGKPIFADMVLELSLLV